MTKPGRQWFPLDCGFTRDDRVLDAGWPAARLYLAALGQLYAAGSQDGRLTRRVAATLGVSSWEKLADRLVKAGLWDEPDPDSFLVVAFNGWRRESDSARRTREWRERQRSQGDVT